MKITANVFSRITHAARAFTLIELLTVIAIIGILAAIIIPTVSKVRKTAQSTRCLSNLRSIGLAMALVVEDKKGRLPGPLNGGQGKPAEGRPGFTQYTSTDTGSLGHHLSSYMGLPSPAKNPYTDLLICPSFGRDITDASAPSYLLATRFDKEKGAGTDHSNNGYNEDLAFPFGYPGRSDPIDNPGKYSPKRISDIHDFAIPTSRLWALVDCDRKVPGGVEDAGWKNKIPQVPIHGNYRNALFFDWHVGKISEEGAIR